MDGIASGNVGAPLAEALAIGVVEEYPQAFAGGSSAPPVDAAVDATAPYSRQ